MMKKDTWKMVIQIAISILTAIATSLGEATTAPPYYIYRWSGLFYFRSFPVMVIFGHFTSFTVIAPIVS